MTEHNMTDAELKTAKMLDWLTIGIDNGWVSDPFCYTHDGDPYMTEEEEQEWEDGGDPCCPVLKILV